MDHYYQNASSDADDRSSDRPDPMTWIPVTAGSHSWGRNDNANAVLWKRPVVPDRALEVYGLEDMPVNCDKIFKLFRMYGNVWTVKVSKDGGRVLVEMGDVEAAQRCVQNLHSLAFEDEFEMNVYYTTVRKFEHFKVTGTLADGTPAEKIYRGSRFNLFDQGEAPSRHVKARRVSKFLRYLCTPFDLDAIERNKKKAFWSTSPVRWLSFALAQFDLVVELILAAIVLYLFLCRSPAFWPPTGAAVSSTGLVESKSFDLAPETILFLNLTRMDPSAAGSATQEPIGGRPLGPNPDPTSVRCWARIGFNGLTTRNLRYKEHDAVDSCTNLQSDLQVVQAGPLSYT